MRTLCFTAVLTAGFSFSVYAATTNVTTVADLIAAVRDASANDEIVVMASGSPYEFSADQKDVVGHLYARVAITLRGETGNPDDVVLVGNANRILYLAKAGNTISGLTFRNGDCTGYDKRSEEPYDQVRGGAICLRTAPDTTTVVSNCAFESCKSVNGGGACAGYNANSGKESGRYLTCRFVGNSCTGTGGGAVCYAASVANSEFRNNSCGGGNGGALIGVADVSGSSIVSNATSSSAGYGGGVFECTLTGCYVASNYAYRCGAAADSKFYSCTNEANSAGNFFEFGAKSAGGGCYAEDSRFVNVGRSGSRTFGSSGFSRCRFGSGSFVSGSYVFSQWVAMTNCLISNNSGFRFFDGLTSASAMVNCSIVSNAYTMASGSSQVLTVENCLFNGNQIGGNFIDVNDKTPTFTLVFNNCILSAASADYVPGRDNYNYYSERATFNPGFVGAAKDPANPFAITRKSPAFEKAGIVEDWMTTATDIRGEGFPRLRDGAVNIGCYQCWDLIPGLSVIIR